MDELRKALSISVTGKLREDALAGCRSQLREWELGMPPVEPLVLDFGLGDFRKIGLIEYWIANEATAGYCGKYLFVFAGQACPAHRHEKKHETFCVVKGRVRMEADGAARVMAPGDILVVPPGVVHSFAGTKPALLLELSTPCVIEDNFFVDSKVPIGGNYRREGQ